MGDYNTIRYEVEGGLLLLTLNRPDQMNAFTVEMADELTDAFGRASKDDDVAAIVVTGAGKAFCAGMDLSVEGNVFGLDESLTPTLKDMDNWPLPTEIESGVRDTGGQVTLAIYECLKPVVGAINGAAAGIGATMCLAMDFRLASTKARLGFVFGRIGIVPEACSTWFLPRIVGLEKALELFYRADIVSAEDALDIGLVRSVHEPDDLVAQASELARSLVTDRSPVSVALIRQMTLQNHAQPHPRRAHEVESLGVFYTSKDDGKEGVAAFLEKRQADFKAKASEMPPFYPWQDD